MSSENLDFIVSLINSFRIFALFSFDADSERRGECIPGWIFRAKVWSLNAALSLCNQREGSQMQKVGNCKRPNCVSEVENF